MIGGSCDSYLLTSPQGFSLHLYRCYANSRIGYLFQESSNATAVFDVFRSVLKNGREKSAIANELLDEMQKYLSPDLFYLSQVLREKS